MRLAVPAPLFYPSPLFPASFFRRMFWCEGKYLDRDFQKNLNRQQLSKTSNGHLFLFFLKAN
jgi:hypothetical protein